MTALWLLNYVLQTTSVAVLYVVGFTGPTFVLGAVTLYQLFRYTPLWPFVILYLSWVFLVDWKTPERGGRDLLRNFARRLAIFKYMKDYYPITLIKTSELDPQKNYIFDGLYKWFRRVWAGCNAGYFFTEGASIGFGTDACGFGEKFPGIIPHLAVHSVLVKAWLYRDMLMSLGIVDATLDSLKYVLTQMGAGHSIVLVVGGAAEVNNCRPDSYVLLFSRRKGFIKLALETGCDLVPVFAFGQNNLFPLVGGGYNSRFSRFQRWLYSKTRAGCFCCWGLSWCLPKRSPIFVVVGSPIPVEKVENPTQDTIDKLHSRYIEDIKELYKKYVKVYHPTDKSELLIV